MSELRHGPVTGRPVLLAPGRSARPHTVATTTRVAAPDHRACPFCPGHEHETPPETARTGSGAPDTPGWRVRVVPNLYPIVGGSSGRGGEGAHEVVILGPDHGRDLGQLDDDEVAEVFRVLRDRARAHAAAGFAHVQVLVNQGPGAGASIAHPHAQVLAIGFVPPAVADAVARFGLAARDLVIDDANASAERGCGLLDGRVRAWCPWAGASPYETRIAAETASARFEAADDPTLDAVAIVTRDVVAGIGRVLGEFDYNVVVHNAPARGDVAHHWYVTVLPRVSTLAGFELGTGVLVNTLDPAIAASHLRDMLGPRPPLLTEAP